MKNTNSLPRLFVSPEKINGGAFYIDDDNDIHKIRQVLRMSAGDNLRIFDGAGSEYLGSISSIEKKVITGEITEKIKIVESEKPYIILAQALTRSQKLEEIIKMNTEVGVDEFIFFESDHSIVKVKDFKETKFERFEKIVLEASRQSERSFTPIINHKLYKFEELANIEADNKIFLFERNDEKNSDINKILENINNQSRIVIIIGPEGGFSKREQEFAQKNFDQIHLNLPILRTETAGIVFSSFLLIGYEFCKYKK